ncbi:MAG: pseudouridine synthase [Sorangiineae bacterium]|nr:pseudouridine synthase [Polyangiaceae bacterium]MEB2322306.1 pseudouridine synthase [Sorangiineae bacterium]
MSARSRLRRWVAPDGASLAALLAELGEELPAALAEGRVFVAGRRASLSAAALALTAGTVVEAAAARSAPEGTVTLLGEAGGLVAAYKPPALPTEPDRAGRASVRQAVASKLGIAEERLHACSRLDVGVSGVVLFARTAQARRAVRAAHDAGALARHYVAIAQAAPAPPAGAWDAPLGGRAARTRYALVARGAGVAPAAPPSALLAVEPASGRTHQIRLHAAGAGAPLLGDRAHGGLARITGASGSVAAIARVALHAAWVALELDGRALRFEAPAPRELAALWSALSGEPAALVRALAPLARG